MKITGLLTLILVVLVFSCSGPSAGPFPAREPDGAGMPKNLRAGQCVKCVELTETIYKDTDSGLSTRLKKVVTGPILSIGKDEITILAEQVEMDRQVCEAGIWRPDNAAFKGPGVEKGERFVFRPFSRATDSPVSRTVFRRYVERCQKK